MVRFWSPQSTHHIRTVAASGMLVAGGGAGGAYRGSAAVLDLLGGLLARVPIEAPSDDEQSAILAALFPDLGPLLPAAMQTLAIVHAAAASGRRVAPFRRPRPSRHPLLP